MSDNRTAYNGDNMPILVTRWDCTGHAVNILYNDLNLGMLPNEFLGKNFRELGLEQQIYEKCQHYFNRVLVTTQKTAFQLHSRMRDYQVSFLPECNSDGEMETVLGIVRDMTGEQKAKGELDITNRKSLEIELKERTEQLEKVNDLLTAGYTKVKMAAQIAKLGYFEWDIANGEIYWSDEQYRNFGYSPQEFIPTRAFIRSRIHPDDRERVYTTDKVSRKRHVESQFRIIRPDGSVGWLCARSKSVMDERGCLVKICGITQDITEQRQTEDRIHRVEKDLIFTNQLYSRSAYLNKLLVNSYSAEYITKALNEFGIETKAAHCCFVVQLTDKSISTAETPDYTVSARITGKQAVLVWLAEKELGWIWKFNEDIVLLITLTDSNIDSKQSQIEFANRLIGEIATIFPHICVKIGISGTSSIPIDFRDIYEKANRAAVVAASIDCSPAVHCDDIGIYEVAFQLLHDKNTCGLVQNTIGRLAEYDQTRGSNLLFTLELILENMSLKVVSQKLFIHHNTAIWRKRRIESFLGMSLDKMETKVLLILYLKIWKLQKAETGENR
ncbi:PAS domain-containing protein [Sporomusa sp.]|uniref:PAS domain-containing protein n=1 Tax=Sporomusa sp. TaxID=2078658 RepID=UPI002CAA7012|nr:PAS domain-containing protein [Sporomusa sp.]HWR42630.1 PAS domain-containing protein [Sporomusa sp.]